MKILARSFEDQDPAILLGMIHDSKTIKDAFDGKFHEVIRWAIIDQEIENRKPVLYIQTDEGNFFTTSSVIIKHLQEYDDAAKQKGVPLPWARFYKGKSRSGREFFGIYFDQQIITEHRTI